MKKGRFESSASAKKHTKKVVALLLVMLLLVGSVVGTTLAWLTAEVTTVQDTFTVGAVSIYLNDGDTGADGSWSSRDENGKKHAIAPGVAITDFDPYIAVAASSEDCWLFVEVDHSAKLTLALADGWTLVDGETNVYARSAKNVAGEKVQIIKDNKVTPDNDTATGDQTVDITGYAVQAEGFATAKAAWEATFGATQG